MIESIYTCQICQNTASIRLEDGQKEFNCNCCGEPFKVSYSINGFVFIEHGDKELMKEISDACAGYVRYKTGNYGPVTEHKRNQYEKRKNDPKEAMIRLAKKEFERSIQVYNDLMMKISKEKADDICPK